MTKSLEECETFFEKWIYILKNIQNMEAIPAYLKDTMEEIKYFEQVMDEASMTREERVRYERSLKYYLDEIDSIEYYEAKGRAEGEAKGRAEGEAKGRAEGEAKGRAEGEKEGVLKTAKKMRDLGISVELTSEATGLSAEIISNL